MSIVYHICILFNSVSNILCLFVLRLLLIIFDEKRKKKQWSYTRPTIPKTVEKDFLARAHFFFGRVIHGDVVAGRTGEKQQLYFISDRKPPWYRIIVALITIFCNFAKLSIQYLSCGQTALCACISQRIVVYDSVFFR